MGELDDTSEFGSSVDKSIISLGEVFKVKDFDHGVALLLFREFKHFNNSLLGADQ